MSYFHYQNNLLFAESCSLIALAEQFGTPCYVYSRGALTAQWQAFHRACGNYPHRICFAVKANSNLAVLNVLARLGSGFDIVSIGELERVLAAGGQGDSIIFSGVGKQREEIDRAIMVGIDCFNIESIAELELLNARASALGKIVPVSLRVNPNVSAKTHPYIATGLKENKFGIPIEEAYSLYMRANSMPHLKLKGVACHIGSQILDVQPFQDALEILLNLIDQLAQAGIILTHIDMGGGLGVNYSSEKPIKIRDFVSVLIQQLADRNLTLCLEPGRAIAAPAGILLTRVISLKHQPAKNFAIVDAGMNDLMRPALYEAWHNILPVQQRESLPQMYEVVGPVCETGDFLGKERNLAIANGDFLAVMTAGAYGFVMSSNYNTRPRPAEVMVDGRNAYLIRPRETVASLFADEACLP